MVGTKWYLDGRKCIFPVIIITVGRRKQDVELEKILKVKEKQIKKENDEGVELNLIEYIGD